MEMFIIKKSQLALQCYDNKSLSKEQLSKIIGINLETGDMGGEWENLTDTFDESKAQFLMQIYDRQLLSKEILVKQIFNLDVEDEEE